MRDADHSHLQRPGPYQVCRQQSPTIQPPPRKPVPRIWDRFLRCRAIGEDVFLMADSPQQAKKILPPYAMMDSVIGIT